MPRTYIVEEKSGLYNLKADWKDYAGTAGVGEKYVLGNTDFDAIYNPITAFNFVLEVEGIYFLPIKSVRAFTKENEFEYIREGGVNDYVHLKRKPISKPFTFQIERYVGTERFLDPLANGTELILPLILYVYRHKARQGITAAAPTWPSRVYTFTGCTVMSKEYGELNAEKAGLVTETTTISYRELVVLTNPFESMNEAPEWNPNDQENVHAPGYTTKYAAFQPNDDASKATYVYQWVTEDGVVRQKVNPKSGYKPYKPAWDGTEEGDTWAKKATPDQADATYSVETENGIRTVTRKDQSVYNRPQYKYKDDYGKNKYAKQADIDTNDGEKIYEASDVPGSLRSVKRIDHASVNKAAWDGAKGTKVAWATQSKPDQANNTYKVTTKDGVQTVTRKDNSQFNAGAYDYAKDKTKLKRAQEAYVDQNAGVAIYKKKGDHIVRNDGADMQKEPYSYAKDQQNVKWAKESPKDSETPDVKDPWVYDGESTEVAWAAESPIDHETPEVKEPWQYSETNTQVSWAQESKKDREEPEVKEPYQYGEKNTANKWAKTSKKDSEKPEVKDPYKYGEKNTANKWAKTSDKDSEKPEEKPPYSIKDGATAKYAKTSPVDQPLQTPVTWPPTRRALMAENLKK